MSEIFIQLLNDIRQCTLCQEFLPLGINPVLQISPTAKIIIAGQAPGIKVHQSGVPFDDKSGERLRQWLDIDKATFYDKNIFAILPMAFCYPGKGKSGDLPPRSECAEKWRVRLLQQLPDIELIITIGTYAQNWHLPDKKEKTLTETVKNWQYFYNETTPTIIPIPHPSPRNNIWLKKNTWFEQDVVPTLQAHVHKIINK
ncbi:uracil-DNA glycosylase family protein [Cognaticolwellia mytili]|uniref:uracil-DNA glycosylase family protein n=1 Tax=Cognaticolwellia mytili TaxID=1888913 RepID=UPI000A176C46|nr:uracil-DNA glycosylase family protein [Cognaticolwellia mytili]